MSDMIVWPAFALALTFTGIGPHDGPHSNYTMIHHCDDQACVDEVYAHAWESPYLARIRVWKGSEAFTFPKEKGGQPMYPPLRDEWFR